ncbi:MAG: class I SAM-dependent methyltransferase [Alphaproteobacteria bacterium]|nr:class I SAM-dependent methyltransferase [Alphaproteobacteria bacterium]MBL6939971.1 class I SAM-dependent methyltransferase [Alphaproteobacteria bacterium]MBL7098173.1 class I SAM-dependent methyltransferase [Alphaproteobacteria bacterium]
MKHVLLGAVVALLAIAGAFRIPCTAHADAPDTIAKAVADPTRPKDDRDADAIRLPAQTLAFAGVKPGMIVGELYPCGGYFSRMISDVIGPGGKDYGLETTRWKGCAEADQKVIDEGHRNFSFVAAPFGEFTAPEKFDLFWITQNYHDLHIKEYGNVDMAAFNRKVFDSLKPGGVYFILDHQAAGNLTDDEIAKVHRIAKAQLIAEVEAAGFKLADEGHFLNRPGDDHTRSIFDKDIRGKTDQYALEFVKP